MKRVFRKNQMIITALALLIAVAGYISYTQTNTDSRETVQRSQETVAENQETMGDELLDISEEDLAKSIFTDTEAPEFEEDNSDVGMTVLTSAESSNTVSQMKLNREQTRSKNKETLMEIINNDNISDAQKSDAIEQLEEMTEIAEKETAAENLLSAKGFTDAVVSITDDEVDVVLNLGDASEAKRAQVEDIVKRKTGISAENIVITPITK